MKNNQPELLAEIEKLEERIELQIMTLQVIRGHLNDLMDKARRLKEDLV